MLVHKLLLLFVAAAIFVLQSAFFFAFAIHGRPVSYPYRQLMTFCGDSQGYCYARSLLSPHSVVVVLCFIEFGVGRPKRARNMRTVRLETSVNGRWYHCCCLNTSELLFLNEIN